MSANEKFLQMVEEEANQQQSQGLPEGPGIYMLPGSPPSPTSASDVVDVGIRAHQAAVTHLEECMNLLDYEEGEGEPPNVATMAPFCGCTDCVVREVLFAAYPILTGQAYNEPLEDHDGAQSV